MDERTLNELLECSVCLDRLDSSSKVLPCQHTFCRRCLEEIVTSQKELRCPECRALVEIKVEDLPANILLIRLLEGLKTVAASPSGILSSGYVPHTDNSGLHSVVSRPTAVQACAKALYNYDAKEPGDLTFRKGDVVLLHKQVDENWFYGQLKGHRGFFPATYVHVIHALPHKDTPPQCTARYDFVIHDENEKDCLSFKKDEVLTVIRRVDENWAEGKLRNRIGIFPISFVEMNAAAVALMSRPLIEPRASVPFLRSPVWSGSETQGSEATVSPQSGASSQSHGSPSLQIPTTAHQTGPINQHSRPNNQQVLAVSLINGSSSTNTAGIISSGHSVVTSAAPPSTMCLITVPSQCPPTTVAIDNTRVSSGAAVSTCPSSTVTSTATATTVSSGLVVPHRHHKRYSLSALGCQRLGIIPVAGNSQRHSMEISGMLPKDGPPLPGAEVGATSEQPATVSGANMSHASPPSAPTSSATTSPYCTVAVTPVVSVSSHSAVVKVTTSSSDETSVSVQTSLSTTAVTGAEPGAGVVRIGNALPAIFQALYSYKPQKSDELELRRGDYYTVVEQCLDGWFKGACLRTGVRGVFPGNYMQAVHFQHSPRCSIANRSRSGLTPTAGVAAVTTVHGLRHGVSRAQSFPKTSPFTGPLQEQRQRKAAANSHQSKTSGRNIQTALTAAGSASRTMETPATTVVLVMSTPVTVSGLQVMSRSSCTPIQHNGVVHTDVSSLSVSTPPPAAPVSPKVPRRQLRRLRGAASLPHEHHKPRAPSPPAEPENGAVGGSEGRQGSQEGPEPRTDTPEANDRSTGKTKKEKERLSIMKRLASAGLPLRGRKARSPPPADGSRPRTRPTHQRSGSDSSLFENTTSCLPNSFRSSENRPPKVKPLTREKYRCVVPYPPQTDQEVELKEGDIVYVHKRRDDGWYKGTHCRSGKSGLFPGSFVEKYKE